MVEVEPGKASKQLLALCFARLGCSFRVFGAVGSERRSNVIVRGWERILGFSRIKFLEGASSRSFVGHRRSLVRKIKWTKIQQVHVVSDNKR